MTVIAAAILSDGRRAVATDGRTTCGQEILTDNSTKILQYPGILMGICGRAIDRHIIADALTHGREDGWTQMSFLKRVTAAYKELGMEFSGGGVGFVEGELVLMDDNFHFVYLDTNYTATGSGYMWAKGYLEACPVLHESALQQSIQCAIRNDNTCGGLVQVYYDD